jgi:hypothetical protein
MMVYLFHIGFAKVTCVFYNYTAVTAPRFKEKYNIKNSKKTREFNKCKIVHSGHSV